MKLEELLLNFMAQYKVFIAIKLCPVFLDDESIRRCLQPYPGELQKQKSKCFYVAFISKSNLRKRGLIKNTELNGAGNSV